MSDPAPRTRQLRLTDVRKRFGGLWAVDGVSLDVPSARIVGLIGPNGSGKTTLLNTVNGVYPPDGGTIELGDTRISGQPPHRLASLGISRTFQAARVFGTLTVRENMLLPTLARGVHLPEARRRAESLLDEVGLRAMWEVPASELSGGQQKLLEFARAQMTSPRLLLMDEPFAGVHPEIVAIMSDRLVALRGAGLSVLVVSHEIPALMKLVDEVACMKDGQVIATGTADVVESDPHVLEAYLGTRRERRNQAAT